MPVEINISKHVYEFINPETGQPMSKQEIAQRYPGLAVGGHRLSDATTELRERKKEEETE